MLGHKLSILICEKKKIDFLNVIKRNRDIKSNYYFFVIMEIYVTLKHLNCYIFIFR